MKRILAIVLALVMALSITSVAFAANKITCPYCKKEFTDSDIYNEHITICRDQQNGYGDEDAKVNIGDLSIADIIDKMLNVFDINASWWDGIEDIIIRIMDFVENIGNAFVALGDAVAAK